MVGRNTYPGIAHSEVQDDGRCAGYWLTFNSDAHFPVLGKLSAVTDEVSEYLPEPVRITDNSPGDIGTDFIREGNMFVGALGRERLNRSATQFRISNSTRFNSVLRASILAKSRMFVIT